VFIFQINAFFCVFFYLGVVFLQFFGKNTILLSWNWRYW